MTSEYKRVAAVLVVSISGRAHVEGSPPMPRRVAALCSAHTREPFDRHCSAMGRVSKHLR